jgi:hypothetical protein
MADQFGGVERKMAQIEAAGPISFPFPTLDAAEGAGTM